MDNISILPVFATPIFSVTLPSISEHTKQFLKQLPYERMPINNGSQSVAKRVLDLPECKELKESIMGGINVYTKDIIQIKKETNFYITNSWMTLHEPEDWSQSHTHSNSLFSGCFYLECSADSGDIVFDKPTGLNNCISPTIDLDCDNWNIYTAKSWSIKPTNNLLIMFPSHLPHSVTNNKTKQRRYSLAFNVFVKGKIGDERSVSELTL